MVPFSAEAVGKWTEKAAWNAASAPRRRSSIPRIPGSPVFRSASRACSDQLAIFWSWALTMKSRSASIFSLSLFSATTSSEAGTPSCPRKLSPKTYTSPPWVRSSECVSPVATCFTLTVSYEWYLPYDSMRRGAERYVLPFPFCPLSPAPQAHTAPWESRSRPWCFPHAIWFTWMRGSIMRACIVRRFRHHTSPPRCRNDCSRLSTFSAKASTRSVPPKTRSLLSRHTTPNRFPSSSASSSSSSSCLLTARANPPPPRLEIVPTGRSCASDQTRTTSSPPAE
mmetsp:Transcript_30232/g.71913  ORF Transcript_30232/g.71913 Transcript_30232/m.71913 type:complete len:282 (-) Transcript_30232:587-1432(-)